MVARISNVSSKAFSQILVPPKIPAVAPARPPVAVKPAAPGKAAPPSFTVSLGQTMSQAGLYTSSGATNAAMANTTATAKPPTAGTTANTAPAAPATATVSSSDNGYIAGSGQVVVDIMSSDSGYDNKIFWSSGNFATRHYLGIDNHTRHF